jgi:hypothetical protein
MRGAAECGTSPAPDRCMYFSLSASVRFGSAGLGLGRKTAERELNRAERARLRAQEAALRERVLANANGDGLADLDAELKALAEAVQALNHREKKIVENASCSKHQRESTMRSKRRPPRRGRR